MIAIGLEVLIDSSFNESLGLGRDLVNDGWNDGALDQGDQNISDLGDEASGKLNIDIVWVHVNGQLLSGNFWCKFVRWSTWLS